MRITILTTYILFAIFVSACSPRPLSLSPFDENVGALIQKKCNFEIECRIRISDATDFDWDEMYILRNGLLDVEAKDVLPEVGELWGEFNRKIVFLKDGKRVNKDESVEIIEGEHTPHGMLFFKVFEEGNPNILRYFSNVEFIVRIQKTGQIDIYELDCANCAESPVFAEFVTVTNSSGTKQ